MNRIVLFKLLLYLSVILILCTYIPISHLLWYEPRPAARRRRSKEGLNDGSHSSLVLGPYRLPGKIEDKIIDDDMAEDD